MSKITITEEMGVHKDWYQEAKEMTIDKLPEFINRLMNDYQHDYGTVCHALTAGGIAAMWAMNNHPQGCITGFQAGCIMWQFVRQWNYSSNKTGLKLVDYDNFLYPQYDYKHDKTITPDTWASIQLEAKNRKEEADREYAQWVENTKTYAIEMAKFIDKYPDYHQRPDYYERLGCGTSKEWDEYNAKVDSGFEFAPRKPYCSLTPDSPVYLHWCAIINGVVPFGYTVKDN